MKKLICLLFALALCLGALISCGSTTEGSTESSVADSENTEKTVKITFSLSGGEIVDGKSYVKIESGKKLKTGNIPTVVREGYALVGWENSSTNKMWKESDVFKKNTTLVAVWETDNSNGEGVNGMEKYNYDMSDYISLPDYKNHRFEIDMADIKHAIGTYLMQFSSEYTVRRGDKIQVDIRFYDLLDPVIDAKGSEITELSRQNLWLEAVGMPNGEGEYQISSLVERNIVGAKFNNTVSFSLNMDDGFFVEEYRGKRLFVDITVKNKACEAGDVLTAAYTGYYIDENGNIIKENGKDKTFDSSDNSPFFIGSHLAIEDFEKGLIGSLIGEEKDIYATFPEDYASNPALAGQRVLFKVKIKALYTPPAYNDDFVKKYFSTSETVEEFESLLIRELVLSKVYDYIDENAQVLEYPIKEYNEAKAQLDNIAEIFQSQYGMTIEQHISSQYDMSIDQYIKSNMKTEMIFYRLQEIIGADAIPTEAEIKAEREALIEQNKNEYMSSQGLTQSQAIAEAKKYVDSLGADYIYEQVMYDKIDDIIPKLVQKDIIPTDLVFSWENN